MNVTNNRDYLQQDYQSIVRNVAETLPEKEQLPANSEAIENEELMSDEQRELFVGYIGHQSKVDQIDIYLRGSTNGEVGYDGVLPGVQSFNDMQNKMRISDVYA
jgi:hypothetical protein